MPIEPDSVENSIQIVPTAAAGFGAELVGRGVYFSSMDVVGRAEKVIFLRLSWGFRRGGKGRGGDYVRGSGRQKSYGIRGKRGEIEIWGGRCGGVEWGGGGGGEGAVSIAHSGPPFESPNFSLKSSSDILTSSSDNSYPYTALAATRHDQTPAHQPPAPSATYRKSNEHTLS